MNVAGMNARAATCAVLIALLPALMSCGAAQEPNKTTPQASVTTAVATKGSLSEVVVGYGVAVASPSHTLVIAMPHEGTIASVDVRDGGAVRAGQTLATIDIAPVAAAQFAQARSALELAKSDLARVERLYADKLATNDQLGLAHKALVDAQASFDQQVDTGANKAQDVLVAPFDGVVTGLAAMPGDRPAVGSAIATVSGRSDVAVRIGLELADAVRLKAGAPVRLTPAHGGDEIVAVLSSVGVAVDSTTRLVPVMAQIPANGSTWVTLGSTLVARVELPPADGVVVPRGALLEDEQGTYLFAVVDGKAQRQAVKVGAETEASALITEGVDASTEVVVSGNAALEDGVAVTEATR